MKINLNHKEYKATKEIESFINIAMFDYYIEDGTIYFYEPTEEEQTFNLYKHMINHVYKLEIPQTWTEEKMLVRFILETLKVKFTEKENSFSIFCNMATFEELQEFTYNVNYQLEWKEY